MKREGTLLNPTRLEAWIQGWADHSCQGVDRFYPVCFWYLCTVVFLGSAWLLFNATEIAPTLTADPVKLLHLQKLLLFRGWVLMCLLVLGCYAYFRNWYPATVFSAFLFTGIAHLAFDMVTVYPARLTDPQPRFVLLLLIRLSALWMLFRAIRNIHRLPAARDRANPLLPFRPSAHLNDATPANESLWIVAGTFTAYALLCSINDLLFGALDYSTGVHWVYLPSGFRMMFVLVFAQWGAIGIGLASMAVSAFSYFNSDPIAVIGSGLISAYAPYLSRQVCHLRLGIDLELHNLTARSLLVVSATFAVMSASMHQLLYTWRGHTENFVASLSVMALGDLIGTVIMLYLAKFVLQFMRNPRH